MVDLDEKYKNDTLTSDELREYVCQVNAESVQEKEGRLHRTWMKSDYPSSCSDEVLSDIKRNIDRAIGQGRRRALPVRRILQYAAVFLSVLFAASTAWLYQNKRTLESGEIRFATASGEKANVTLPDGTVVNLNEESSITYKVAAFNRKNRQIGFDGEGYFNVAKQEAKPFVIQAQNIRVEVLGTKFLLLNREDLRQSEVMLDEGQVSLQSLLADCHAVLEAGQKAALDFATGRFIITGNHKSGKEYFSRPRLSFNDVSFEEVINRLSDTYRTEIHVRSNNFAQDHFTGYLPSTNLNEALDILSRTYHLKVTLENGEFVLEAK